jgi:transcriptional regulator NrdR family protein
MKEIRRNRVCPNCDKRFVGCKCIRTLASDGSTVHKTCKDQYEYKLKNNEKEEKSKSKGNCRSYR